MYILQQLTPKIYGASHYFPALKVQKYVAAPSNGNLYRIFSVYNTVYLTVLFADYVTNSIKKCVMLAIS